MGALEATHRNRGLALPVRRLLWREQYCGRAARESSATVRCRFHEVVQRRGIAARHCKRRSDPRILQSAEREVLCPETVCAAKGGRGTALEAVFSTSAKASCPNRRTG